MRTTLNNQRGTVAVLFGILLIVLIGFCALAIDVGSWYVVEAELSKSVDAAAFTGAKNISNPYADPLVLAEQLGSENFPTGLLGTPVTGVGTVTFNAFSDPGHRIRVTGTVAARAYLAQLFGINQVATNNTGVASKNNVEIMLVLDRSGSMSGQPIIDLKKAAINFLSFFKDTQADDLVGLISFATRVTVDSPLDHNFVTNMTTKINAMNATGATNAEDALAQVSGPNGLTDQSAVPADKRVQQYVIFFTDGLPTALRDRFKYNNTDYDGVVYGEGTSGHANCRTTDYAYMDVHGGLVNPPVNPDTFWPGVNPDTTGDGKPISTTSCRSGRPPVGYLNTKWYLFGSSLGPVPGYAAESCSIPMNQLVPYFCNAARQTTLDNAQQLKNDPKNVKIYTIGLGTQVDGNFLTQVASGADFYHYAPNSSDLSAIFNAIAKDIKLRLVQ